MASDAVNSTRCREWQQTRLRVTAQAVAELEALKAENFQLLRCAPSCAKSRRRPSRPLQWHRMLPHNGTRRMSGFQGLGIAVMHKQAACVQAVVCGVVFCVLSLL